MGAFASVQVCFATRVEFNPLKVLYEVLSVLSRRRNFIEDGNVEYRHSVQHGLVRGETMRQETWERLIVIAHGYDKG